MKKSNTNQDIPVKTNLIKYSEDLKETILNEIQSFQSILTAPTIEGASTSSSSLESSPPANEEKMKSINSKMSQELLELHKAKCLLKIQNILYCINEHLPD